MESVNKMEGGVRWCAEGEIARARDTHTHTRRENMCTERLFAAPHMLHMLRTPHSSLWLTGNCAIERARDSCHGWLAEMRAHCALVHSNFTILLRTLAAKHANVSAHRRARRNLFEITYMEAASNRESLYFVGAAAAAVASRARAQNNGKLHCIYYVTEKNASALSYICIIMAGQNLYAKKKRAIWRASR